MDKIKALEESIEHWNDNLTRYEYGYLERTDMLGDNCALCELYSDGDTSSDDIDEWTESCDGCPLSMADMRCSADVDNPWDEAFFSPNEKTIGNMITTLDKLLVKELKK
jgi:hypothetical protein